MYFWLKLLHIAAMAVWFTGLFLLPRLLVARAHGAMADAAEPALGRTVYFGVMTPGAVLTIVLGTVLLGFGFQGAWLPAKLSLVAVAVLLHVYYGHVLLDPRQRARPTVLLIRVLNWLPLLLLLAIAALAAAKPGVLPPLGGI